MILLAIVPHEETLTDRVDIVELNHCHNENGELTFSQWIFWRWNRNDQTYHVSDWRLADSPASWTDSTLVFWDRKIHAVRRVTARDRRTTYTQWDRELIERERLPPEHRTNLSGPTPLHQRRNP